MSASSLVYNLEQVFNYVLASVSSSVERDAGSVTTLGSEGVHTPKRLEQCLLFSCLLASQSGISHQGVGLLQYVHCSSPLTLAGGLPINHQLSLTEVCPNAPWGGSPCVPPAADTGPCAIFSWSICCESSRLLFVLSGSQMPKEHSSSAFLSFLGRLCSKYAVVTEQTGPRHGVFDLDPFRA